ncbi:MAG TPA: hypothetical protein VER96_37350 [Polyangiaceae bacterium]|nr:hypothetical protein [Polyangiaceae bacterium]
MVSTEPLVHRCSADDLSRPGAALADLEGCFGLAVSDVFSAEECAEYLAAVHRARGAWVSDFDGEQFSLGRAFYTHLEQDRCREYFADAAASDARVERALPGLSRRLLHLVEQLTGGAGFARRGFCGPGVHIFPAGEKVAREGGVIHFDTEGLPEQHVRLRKRALTVVVMLGLPEGGGGLKLWNARYAGNDSVDNEKQRGVACDAHYEVGGALVIDSYRLHQIQPFSGKRDRVTATVHAAEVDPGRWETWF